MRMFSVSLTLFFAVTTITQAQANRESPGQRPSSLVFTTIDYPGAAATLPNGVNRSRQIVGCYTDIAGDMHGFLLSQGTFQTVDHPNSTFNAAYGVNDSGVIVGTFSTDIQHGYILRREKFITVDFASDINFVSGINGVGDIAGAYDDTCCNLHGYLVTHDKVFTPLDYPGAVRTIADGLNGSDIVVGVWRDANKLFHGFMWESGIFTPIDAPNSTSTYTLGINSSNVIVGYYIDAASVSHGYVLRNGKFHTIDFPGASSTAVFGLNDLGVIVGSYTDTSGVQHGFMAHK